MKDKKDMKDDSTIFYVCWGVNACGVYTSEELVESQAKFIKNMQCKTVSKLHKALKLARKKYNQLQDDQQLMIDSIQMVPVNFTLRNRIIYEANQEYRESIRKIYKKSKSSTSSTYNSDIYDDLFSK